ncbi:hypothetical protein ACQKK5_15715, partial [Brevibacillus panacihumi]|uniref:hypothetical protein n=1 Tax=Brevibacillus panacihumi TaxID=497735 RepID=UPI003CFC9A8E
SIFLSSRERFSAKSGEFSSAVIEDFNSAVHNLRVSKNFYSGYYPDNYFAFWTHLEVETLYALKDKQTLSEVMDYIMGLPQRKFERFEVPEYSGEELPF